MHSIVSKRRWQQQILAILRLDVRVSEQWGERFNWVDMVAMATMLDVEIGKCKARYPETIILSHSILILLEILS